MRAAFRGFSTQAKTGAGSRPWYVSEAAEQLKQATKFELPADAPQRLEPLCLKLADDLGLKDLQIVDARDKPSNPGIMVLGTGLGSRHLGRATQELRSWLKSEGVKAQVEGTLSSNFIRTWRRRTRRRQERQRSYAPAIEVDPTLQQKTGDWIVVDTNENIYVHLMTEDKRQLLDLESLTEEPEDFEEDSREPLWKGFSDPRGGRPGTRQYSTKAASGAAQSHVGSSVSSTITDLDTTALSHINGEPLESLISWVREQLIEGTTFSAKDLKTLLAAITYHKSPEFEAMRVTPESSKQFEAVCDEKAKAVLELCNLITRPRGQLLLSDQTILVLWRAFVAPSSQSITPADALADPTPSARPQGFLDPRFTTLLSLIESQSLFVQPQILVPLCAALINTGYWTVMWRLLEKACMLVDLPGMYIDTIMAMVVKSGNEKQIQSALTLFLPGLYRDNFQPSDNLKRTIEIGQSVLAKSESIFHDS